MIDTVIVLLSDVEIVITNSGYTALPAFRAVRILRIFRILRFTTIFSFKLQGFLLTIRYVAIIIDAMTQLITTFIYLFLLVFLFTYIFAILGMEIFRGQLSKENKSRQNFDSFRAAFSSSF